MKKTILIMAVLAVLLTGCSLLNREPQEPPIQNGDRQPEPGIKMRETVLYLPDQERHVVVPVRVNIPWEEGIARATVSYLVEGNVPTEVQDKGLAPLLPAGTQILGISIRDGLARIDFSREFLNYDPKHERLVINGLVYTLTEFSTITKVEIMVENSKPQLPGGTSISEPFSRESGLNLEVSDAVQETTEASRVTLYFLLQAGDYAYYVPLSRVIPVKDDPVLSVMEELLKGPSPGVLLTAIPRGVTLESLSVQSGKVTLRLAGELGAAGGGQLAADRIRHQLALTLTEVSGVMGVEVLVNGAPAKFAPGISFPQSFGRPKQWNVAGVTQ